VAKAGSENKSVIAAVNRCATQNQERDAVNHCATQTKCNHQVFRRLPGLSNQGLPIEGPNLRVVIR